MAQLRNQREQGAHNDGERTRLPLAPSAREPISRTPQVSVCVPTYNGAATLDATLASVLAEPMTDLEVLVLDNASTDETQAVLAAYNDPRLRVERNETTLDIAANWNRIVELSRGELVKVVCADDVIRLGALVAQVRVLSDDPDIAVVASRRDMIDHDGHIIASSRGLARLIGRFRGEDAVRRIVRSGQNPIGEGAGVMFRRADFDAVGGFRGYPVFTMDLDLWVRLLRRGDFVGQSESLASFRIGTTTVSARATAVQHQEYLGFVRAIAADPTSGVRRADLQVGAMRAPFARLRRVLLFRLVRSPDRVQAAVQRATARIQRR